MALELRQIRKCDGQCCRESPRFPNDEGTDCIFRANATSGKDDTDRLSDQFGCMLMRDAATISKGEKSAIFPDEDAQAVFQRTCVEWPQNTQPVKRYLGDEPDNKGGLQDRVLSLGTTGGCCWQWVEVP